MNPDTDLVLERTLNAPVDRVWRAWTVPEQLKQWFCPRPWRTTEAVIELWPGGKFLTRMEGPDGGASGGEGCILEVVPNERLTWTGALLAGFRPPAKPDIDCGEGTPADMVFTATISMSDAGNGRTNYRAHVMHAHQAGRRAHEAMGFHDGWGAAAAQLEEVAAAG